MHLKLKSSGLVALTLAALSAVSQASAAVVTYSTRGDFNSAVPGNVEADEFANANFGQPFTQAATLTLGSLGVLNLTGFNDTLDGANRGGSPSFGTTSTGTITTQPGQTFTSALLYLGTNNAGGIVNVTLSTGETFQVQTGFNPVYFGFTSSAAETSITISPATAGQTANLVDYYSGDISQTPEGTTLVMVAAGLIAIGLRRRGAFGGGNLAL